MRWPRTRNRARSPPPERKDEVLHILQADESDAGRHDKHSGRTSSSKARFTQAALGCGTYIVFSGLLGRRIITFTYS